MIKRNKRIVYLLSIMLLTLTVVLSACGPEETVSPTSPPAQPTSAPDSGNTGGGDSVQTINFEHGFGATKGFWQVYFTDPPGSGEDVPSSGGIDTAIASAIDNVQNSLDIAAFEWNNIAITEAVLRAHERGVTVRMVADNEHTVEEDDSTISQLEEAGIPIVYDERSALMHNKFMIMDRTTVWTGSTNYTMNGVYRNNNNMIAMRSQPAVQTYQAEFDEMFGGTFGPRGSEPNNANFTQDGTIIRVMFSPEDEVNDVVTGELAGAESSVKFMAFSFTLDEFGDALLSLAEQGVEVEGIFETRGSETDFSEMPRLLCAGLDVRQDGNPRTMHHKVFIIDEERVLTGSFNFSDNATTSNDENLAIIYDADLAAQYLAEYERVKSQASTPDDIECN